MALALGVNNDGEVKRPDRYAIGPGSAEPGQALEPRPQADPVGRVEDERFRGTAATRVEELTRLEHRCLGDDALRHVRP